MTFRLSATESPSEGFKRLAAELIDGFRSSEGLGADARVHLARKTCKKLRALIVLHEPLLPAPQRAMTYALRETSGHLAAAREAAVLVKLYDEVMERKHKSRARLKRERRRLARVRGALITDTLVDLDALMPALTGWSPRGEDAWTRLADPLVASYRRARRAHPVAREDIAGVHRWRKRLKTFAYQQRLMREVDPATFCADPELDRLTDAIGRYHDLMLIVRRLSSKRERHRFEEAQQALWTGIEAIGTPWLARPPRAWRADVRASLARVERRRRGEATP